jgi:hypothetical protein
MLRFVNEVARYTKIHVKYNILISGKFQYPANLWSQRCPTLQILLYTVAFLRAVKKHIPSLEHCYDAGLECWCVSFLIQWYTLMWLTDFCNRVKRSMVLDAAPILVHYLHYFRQFNFSSLTCSHVPFLLCKISLLRTCLISDCVYSPDIPILLLISSLFLMPCHCDAIHCSKGLLKFVLCVP